MVGAAELPVEKTFVATTLGITGAGLGGSDSSFLGAMLTEGAEASSILQFSAAAREAAAHSQNLQRILVWTLHAPAAADD